MVFLHIYKVKKKYFYLYKIILISSFAINITICFTCNINYFIMVELYKNYSSTYRFGFFHCDLLYIILTLK